jgi:hypothetical protein
MPIGPDPIVPVDTAGFPISNSIKLLGMEINRSLNNLEDAFVPILEKVEKIIRFWDRFHLTLPGRLAIMKTLLIPQLNYLGCFLVPKVDTLRLIQLAIDKFVIKNLNISVGRRYLPPEKGGLGIFELSSFLLAQRCSWIKRAHSLPIDNWRFDLRRFSPSGLVHDIRT